MADWRRRFHEHDVVELLRLACAIGVRLGMCDVCRRFLLVSRHVVADYPTVQAGRLVTRDRCVWRCGSCHQVVAMLGAKPLLPFGAVPSGAHTYIA